MFIKWRYKLDNHHFVRKNNLFIVKGPFNTWICFSGWICHVVRHYKGECMHECVRYYGYAFYSILNWFWKTVRLIFYFIIIITNFFTETHDCHFKFYAKKKAYNRLWSYFLCQNSSNEIGLAMNCNWFENWYTSRNNSSCIEWYQKYIFILKSFGEDCKIKYN